MWNDLGHFLLPTRTPCIALSPYASWCSPNPQYIFCVCAHSHASMRHQPSEIDETGSYSVLTSSLFHNFFTGFRWFSLVLMPRLMCSIFLALSKRVTRASNFCAGWWKLWFWRYMFVWVALWNTAPPIVPSACLRSLVSRNGKLPSISNSVVNFIESKKKARKIADEGQLQEKLNFWRDVFIQHGYTLCDINKVIYKKQWVVQQDENIIGVAVLPFCDPIANCITQISRRKNILAERYWTYINMSVYVEMIRSANIHIIASGLPSVGSPPLKGGIVLPPHPPTTENQGTLRCGGLQQGRQHWNQLLTRATCWFLLCSGTNNPSRDSSPVTSQLFAEFDFLFI